MTKEKARQFLDFLKWALGPGGVVLILLAQIPSLQAQFGQYVTIASTVVGAIATAWSAWDQYTASKDSSILAASAQVPGVKFEDNRIKVNPRDASLSAIKAAQSDDPAFAKIVKEERK